MSLVLAGGAARSGVGGGTIGRDSRPFLADFESLIVRHQEAQLQTTLRQPASFGMTAWSWSFGGRVPT